MKKILNIVYFLVGVSLLVFLGFSSHKNRADILCKSLDIRVDTKGDLFFVSAEMVQDLILENQDSVLGKPFEDINIYLLEDFVNKHPNIEKAELYLALNGSLSVDVKQRKPIARVFEQEQSYYLDSQINPIPMSDRYSARVLQVYWTEITAVRKNRLRSVLDLIEADAFLKAQITALEFDDKDEIILYPRVGDHKIILGKTQNIDEKFEKLKIFYRHGLEKVGWDRYSHINLKFENQVVCTKR